MIDWLIEAAWAGVAHAGDLDDPPSTWGMIVINLIITLPATIGAYAAFKVSQRNSVKADKLQESSDSTGTKADKIQASATDAKFAALDAAINVKEAVSTAAEDVRAHAVVVQEIKDHIGAHAYGLRDVVAKISTAAEDIKRMGEVTGEIKGALGDSMKTISTVAEDVRRMNNAVDEIKKAISVSEEAVKTKVNNKKQTE